MLGCLLVVCTRRLRFLCPIIGKLVFGTAYFALHNTAKVGEVRSSHSLK